MKRYTGRHVALTALCLLPFVAVRCQPVTQAPEIGTAVTVERCTEHPVETSEAGCSNLRVPSGQIAVCQVFEGGELIQYPDGHRQCER